MRLLISDEGNLGKALGGECEGRDVSFEWYSAQLKVPAHSRWIAVYVGRGRKFKEFLSFCARHNLPVLQCSSDVDTFSEDPHTPLFDVLNAAESASIFIKQMEGVAADLKRRDVEIDWVLTESHQASKTSPPRTALYLANVLGIDTNNKNKFRSLRGRTGFHAYHGLQGYIKDSVEMLEYGCRIEGLEPYAVGIINLARRLDKEIGEAGMRTSRAYHANDIRGS